MKLMPARGYLLASLLVDDNKTESGLFVVRNDEHLKRGVVLSIGEAPIEHGQVLDWGVQVGDAILFQTWELEFITINKEPMVLVNHGNLRGWYTE